MTDPTPDDLAGARVVCAEIREQTETPVDIIARAIAKARAEERERLSHGREHCPSCICGKRAPVQGDPGGRPRPARGPGSVTWAEHLAAWSGYAHENGRGQSAERMAERGGFSYYELTVYLGREPTTWEPR